MLINLEGFISEAMKSPVVAITFLSNPAFVSTLSDFSIAFRPPFDILAVAAIVSESFPIPVKGP